MRSKLIKTIKHTDQLHDALPRGLTYSILDHRNIFRTQREMREIYHAVYGAEEMEKSVVGLIPFRPQRILQQEILIGISTKLQMKNLDIDLKRKYKTILDMIDSSNFVVYSEKIKKRNLKIIKKIHEAREKKELEVLAHNPKYKRYIEAYNKISLHPTYHPEGALTEDAKVILATDEITNHDLREEAIKLVNICVERKISSGIFKPLTKRDAAHRETLAITGGIASGKGTSEAIMRYHTEYVIKRDWSDFVKVNGDSYKLILNPQYADVRDGDQALLFSQLVQDEATLIKDSIEERCKKMLDNTGKAPDIILDLNCPTPMDMEMATRGGGKLSANIVSIPVEKAIERAWGRGLSTGRYEHAEFILSKHKTSTTKFLDYIEEYAGRNVEYLALDNDVPRGEQANIFAKFDCEKRTIEILNPEYLKKFLKKTKIDISKTLSEQDTVYYEPHDENILYEQFLNRMSHVGYTITVPRARGEDQELVKSTKSPILSRSLSTKKEPLTSEKIKLPTKGSSIV